jgi:hypothetical protein
LEGLGLQSKEEMAREFVARWATMPLTRAVDSLILQVTGVHTPTMRALRKVAAELPEGVEWIDEAGS